MSKEVTAFGLDRYDLNARLRPALLAVLPLLVVAGVWLPSVWTLIGGLASLLTACGVTLLLSRIARHWGRQLQERLKLTIGPVNSMRALRHADISIEAITKARYHEALRRHGLHVPTAAEEEANPAAADLYYRGCVTWLQENTRDRKRFNLLAGENLDFGFRRNLLALKPVAVPLLLVCLAGNALVGYFQWKGFDSNFWKAAVLEIALMAAAAGWILAVNEAFVADASQAFAVRLLASCDILRANSQTR
jgi:hypothetical protein